MIRADAALRKHSGIVVVIWSSERPKAEVVQSCTFNDVSFVTAGHFILESGDLSSLGSGQMDI